MLSIYLKIRRIFYRQCRMYNTTTIGIPSGTRLLRIIRHDTWWQLWIATKDYVHGTYLACYDDGRVMNITLREGDGPDEFHVRPSDDGKGFW